MNECLSNNGNCSVNCTNTVGSYMCLCNSGYMLNADARTCAGKQYMYIGFLNGKEKNVFHKC